MDLLANLLDSEAKSVGVELFRCHSCGNGSFEAIKFCDLALWAPACSSFTSCAFPIRYRRFERTHLEKEFNRVVWSNLKSDD